MKKWAGINLKELNRYLGDMLDHLYEIHKGDDIGEKQRKAFVGLTSNVGFLSRHVQALSESYLQDSFKFYFDASKFLYVLLRVFRVLVSKGYCSDDTSEDDDGEADGDINGMTFEDDQDGTGMGEGDGKKDVTDQLESEEQLAGLKDDQDKNEENPENRESKQLDEEEAEQGMEMEGDFNGEMFDLPDKEPDDDMEEQEGEELDREMGSGSPDEQVVDEKMWNESDDDDDINKEEEKFEKDSGVEGEAVEGEIRTMEHDEGDDPKGDDEKKESKPDLQKPQGDDDAGDMGDMDFEEEEDHINDENDDNVEEQHGVDVRGNEQEQQEDTNDENELQLDDDVCLDGEENENGEDNDVEKNVEAGEDIEDSESVGSEVNEDQAEADSPEDEDCDVDPSDAVTSNGQGAVEKDDDPKDESDPQEDPMEDNAIESMNQDPSTEEAHGVKSKQGTDAVMEDEVDDKNEEKEEQGEDEKGGTNGASQAENSQADDLGQGGGYSERDGALDNPTETSGEQDADEIPNPFKDPGDASKFWHKKLNMVDSNPENDSEGGQEENITEEEEQGKGGDFEYAPRDENNSSQVLGEATEEEATKLDNMQKEENDEDEEIENHQNEKDKSVEQAKQRSQRKDKKASQQSKKIESLEQENEDNTSDDEISRMDEDFKEDEAEDREDESSDDGISGNLVTSDLSKLTVGDDDGEFSPQSQLIQDEQISGISSAEAAEARLKWLQIQGETHNLSRRLCEKLRLVMEPLVASKLRGDYRTGKRINMKRVIGYIASGYRKDKIWLRRTKPAKRDYRVLLAIDDSESMKKSGAGEMALHAMATMAVGMNQLEIGELGIASFGDDMKLLHPYHLPFTSESGSDMVVNFGFDQKRTRTALCVESALVSLEQYGDSSSMQLVFLISDGRIERDSRSALRRLIREMAERNILLAMIIVEGKNKKKDSIVNMKEVTFEKGKPVVKRFIDDYPFPYYIILDDMTSLPEVLGGALRQWFEMLAQLNSAK
jgi:midasin